MKPMQDALWRIEQEIQTVKAELAKGSRSYNVDAANDLESALIALSEALTEALDAYTRLANRN